MRSKEKNKQTKTKCSFKIALYRPFFHYSAKTQNTCNLGAPPVVKRGIAGYFFWSVWKFTACINASRQTDTNLMFVWYGILSIVSLFVHQNGNFQVNSKKGKSRERKLRKKKKRSKINAFKCQGNSCDSNWISSSHLPANMASTAICFVFCQVTASCKSAFFLSWHGDPIEQHEAPKSLRRKRTS